MVVPAPMWIERSLTMVWLGKQMMLPAPKVPKRWAMADRGPMPPMFTTWSHDQRIAVPSSVMARARRRLTKVGAGGGR